MSSSDNPKFSKNHPYRVIGEMHISGQDGINGVIIPVGTILVFEEQGSLSYQFHLMNNTAVKIWIGTESAMMDNLEKM